MLQKYGNKLKIVTVEMRNDPAVKSEETIRQLLAKMRDTLIPILLASILKLDH